MRKNSKKDIKQLSNVTVNETQRVLSQIRSDRARKARMAARKTDDASRVHPLDGTAPFLNNLHNTWFEEGLGEGWGRTSGLDTMIDVTIQLSLKSVIVLGSEGSISEAINDLIHKHVNTGELDETYVKRVEAVINNLLLTLAP